MRESQSYGQDIQDTGSAHGCRVTPCHAVRGWAFLCHERPKRRDQEYSKKSAMHTRVSS